jgi:uncharacterized protein (TIGR04255 family)
MLPDFPDYVKPPVNEVVCGITFEKLGGFKAPHFGTFWQRLRDDYPTCQSAPPLVFRLFLRDDNDFSTASNMVISKDLSSVVQVDR